MDSGSAAQESAISFLSYWLNLSSFLSYKAHAWRDSALGFGVVRACGSFQLCIIFPELFLIP